MQQNVISTPQSQSLSVSAALQIVSAMAIGAALLFVVGFAPMDVAHNAAHDARHSFAFPCH